MFGGSCCRRCCSVSLSSADLQPPGRRCQLEGGGAATTTGGNFEFFIFQDQAERFLRGLKCHIRQGAVTHKSPAAAPLHPEPPAAQQPGRKHAEPSWWRFTATSCLTPSSSRLSQQGRDPDPGPTDPGPPDPGPPDPGSPHQDLLNRTTWPGPPDRRPSDPDQRDQDHLRTMGRGRSRRIRRWWR